VVISSAVLEEVLCRGLILETFRKRWGVKTSILLSSLFFGIIHLDWATSIVAVVAGIIFGILYVRTSSLYTTIIIHAVNNAMAFALICFGVGDTPLHDIIGNEMVYYVVYGVAVVVFVAASAESYFRLFRNK
jgi:membrane protease YdiL (CAAX protease family)